MATLDYRQELSGHEIPFIKREARQTRELARRFQGTATMWMALDAITVAVSAVLAILYELHAGSVDWAGAFRHGTLIYGRSMWILLLCLCGFIIAQMITGKRLQLYSPKRLNSIFHEQKLSAQTCLTSGLLLIATLYLIHADDISRRIVLVTLGLVTIFLGLSRLLNRALPHRRFERGIGTRKVLILGTVPEAHLLRRLERAPHLGHTFKRFVNLPGSSLSASEAVGTLDTIFEHTGRQFADEIIIASSCEPAIVENAVEQAMTRGVELRVAPEMYHDFAEKGSVKYIGESPTILFETGQVSEFATLFKRAFDFLFSSVVLILTAPLLLAIAIAVKLDSPGPVFYSSARIGKKGRVFRCIKFRSMIRDAEMQRAKIAHLNERDGVLFKVTNDPRITRLGRFLRKYSLDELPQFLNVLRGEMSVVGPRPPLAEEVKEYELSHLHRLDVTPGITGLWQVGARQDPSFASYVSLDVTYIDTWSIWLDFKIILRTIGVVFAGTGS